MIDLHTHILPYIDDGSSSVEESLQLIKLLQKQNIDVICATPHFYGNRDRLQDFRKKRKEAYIQIQDYVGGEFPHMVLGAEVAYFRGISRAEGIEPLRFYNSDIILIEMPFMRWEQKTIDDVLELSTRRGFKAVLAHVDRYFKFVKSEELRMMHDAGVLFQYNSSFLTGSMNRSKVKKIFADDLIDFWGSDCHNMSSRKPEMDKCLAEIEKIIGKDNMNEVDELQRFKILSREKAI